jgi:hypothetical protein
LVTATNPPIGAEMRYSSRVKSLRGRPCRDRRRRAGRSGQEADLETQIEPNLGIDARAVVNGATERVGSKPKIAKPKIVESG